jgi:hypothetical protein
LRELALGNLQGPKFHYLTPTARLYSPGVDPGGALPVGKVLTVATIVGSPAGIPAIATVAAACHRDLR